MFYDTHAHLDFPDFNGDLEQVIERAQSAGISRIITIATDLESSRRAIALSDRFPNVYAAVGWHPSEAARAPEDVRPGLRPLAQHPKVAALGEIGLDYYRLPSKKGQPLSADLPYQQKQKQVFAQQLQLAAELGLNCVVHQRESFADTILQVEAFVGCFRTVFHCFSNPVTDLARVLAAGSLVSFTGILTFKNAETVRDALSAAPPGKFMLETDAPFLAPAPYRGRRCEPAYVKEIADRAAEVRGISREELGRITCAAADAFFRFS